MCRSYCVGAIRHFQADFSQQTRSSCTPRVAPWNMVGAIPTVPRVCVQQSGSTHASVNAAPAPTHHRPLPARLITSIFRIALPVNGNGLRVAHRPRPPSVYRQFAPRCPGSSAATGHQARSSCTWRLISNRSAALAVSLLLQGRIPLIKTIDGVVRFLAGHCRMDNLSSRERGNNLKRHLY